MPHFNACYTVCREDLFAPAGVCGFQCRGQPVGSGAGAAARMLNRSPGEAHPSTSSGWSSIHYHHDQTTPITLVISGNHRETISFSITTTAQTPLVLGHPWLRTHNPNCLHSVLSPVVPPADATVPDVPPSLNNVAFEYRDLREVFSKDRVLALPPHRPYDCVIDLQPGASLPFSCQLPSCWADLAILLPSWGWVLFRGEEG